MQFGRVPRPSAVDLCVHAVENEILSDRLQPGDRLPSERELAAHLGVSRLTLRAALVRVAANGLIAPKHGVGHIVLDHVRSANPSLMSTVAMAALAAGQLPELAADLLAIRRGLARTVLERLATLTPDPVDLDNLEAEIHELEDAQTPDAAAAADHAVVAALIAASKLRVISLFLNPVFATLATLPALRDAIYADPKDNARRWRAVTAWARGKHRDPGPLLASLEAHDAKTVAKLRKPKK